MTDYDPAFVSFWNVYPLRVGKGAAWKTWQKKQPPLAVVLEALRTQDAWLRREGGKYTPLPTTWLNQGRWQDEPPTIAGGHGDTDAGAVATEAWQDRVDAYGRTPRQVYEAASLLLAYLECRERQKLRGDKP